MLLYERGRLKYMKNMKKKSIIHILVWLLILTFSGFLFVWFQRNANVDLCKTTFAFEYGDVVHLKGENILDTKDTSILESCQVDYANLKLEEGKNYPKIGNYELQIKYSVHGYGKNNTIKIIVEDTKEPEFTMFSDEINVKKGFDLNTLASYFEAKDLSPFEITINTEKLDINQTGTFEVEITAMDTYKNKNVRKAKIIVFEDTVTKPKNIENRNTTPNIEKKPTAYTVTNPRYVNGILIVNKKNPLPFHYAPYENVEAGNQARSLIDEMRNLGYNISRSYSGYRSFDTQAKLYQNYVHTHGQQKADTFSARPGYSEHQTGLAFDLLHQNGALVTNTAEANWIAKNAHRYGFIVRYLVGKEHITGYQAEPWHIRYIGPFAANIYNSGLTLEEYLGIQGGSY